MRHSQGTAWGSFFTSTLVLPHAAWSIPILGQDPAQSIATALLPARARCRGLDVAPGQVRAAPAAGHWAEQHRHCPQGTLCSAPQCDDCSDWAPEGSSVYKALETTLAACLTSDKIWLAQQLLASRLTWVQIAVETGFFWDHQSLTPHECKTSKPVFLPMHTLI